MKVMFVVQGEGRGHLTQSLALSQYLREAGLSVCCVVAGTSPGKTLPEFFTLKINTDVYTLTAPHFVVRDGKKIDLPATLVKNIRWLGTYTKSLKKLDKFVKKCKPDVIINFYELLCGFYYAFLNPGIPLVCVGHQYLLSHPCFCFPCGKHLDRLAVHINTWFTCIRAKEKFALSFTKMRDIPSKKIRVMPPLLRQEVFDLQTEEKGFLLIYLAFQGFRYELQTEHKKNPDTEIHYFCDRKKGKQVEKEDENLYSHKISDVDFLEALRTCSGVMTTSGFETVCEAMYLGKPVYLMPIHDHYEQECNAVDATQAGAGIHGDSFDIARFNKYLSEHKTDNSCFRDWVSSAPERFVQRIKETAFRPL